MSSNRSFRNQTTINAINAINAINGNEDFSTIKEIAQEGIEKNSYIKEKQLSPGSLHLNNCLTMFLEILHANTLEEALNSINQKFPQFSQTQNNESTINMTLR